MEEISFFENNINDIYTTLIELRSGNWANGLTGTSMKREYYKRYKYIISEFETILSSKLLKEETKQLNTIKTEFNDIKNQNKEDYIIEDEFGNNNNVWTTNIDYDKGIIILKKIERLLRNIVERLLTKTRTH